jgi:hypothetical protein
MKAGIGIPSRFQIYQNPAKPGQNGAKTIKEKGLDSLAFPCPNRAFSIGCADPQGHFFFCPDSSVLRTQ